MNSVESDQSVVQTERKRGRPRKYETDLERYQALIDSNRRYRLRNRDKYVEYHRNYYHENKEKLKQQQREAYQRMKENLNK